MQEQLRKRITELEGEYRAGQEMFAELEAKRADLQQTMLRISGAIQVLQELLDAEPGAAGNGAESPQPDTPQPDTLQPDTPQPGQDAQVPSPDLAAG